MIGGEHHDPGFHLANVQVMLLVDSLCQLAEQQSALASEPATVEHGSLIDTSHTRAAELRRAVADAEAELEENQALKQESQEFRGGVTACYGPGWHVQAEKFPTC